MPDAEAPAVSKREELAQAIQTEQKERAHRCKARMETILKEENCSLFATAQLQEVNPGQFVIVAAPGVKAL